MHIVHIISNLGIGGAERILCTLTKELQKLGYTQSVIYFHDGPLRSEIEQLGIITYPVSFRFFRYDISFFLELIKRISSLKPDLIHTALWAANFFGVLVARYLSIPIVASVHAQRSVDGKIRNLLDTITLHKASHIIAITETVKKQLAPSSIESSQITVIENSIDRAALLKLSKIYGKKRNEIGLADNHFVIGSVGRLVSVKNYSFLIASMAPLLLRFQDMRLLIIGSGQEYGSLVELADYLKVRDKITFIPSAPSYQFYSLFDCFVSASTCEALSLVIQEAMSLNIACIVRGKQYFDLLVDGNQALIVDDSMSLQKAILELYNNIKLRRDVGYSGAKLIETSYKLEHMVEKYNHVFKAYAAH